MALMAWFWVEAETDFWLTRWVTKSLISAYAHLLWVSFVVIEDELADPAEIGFLGAQGIMEVAEGFAVVVEQLFRLWSDGWAGCWLGWFWHGRDP